MLEQSSLKERLKTLIERLIADQNLDTSERWMFLVLLAHDTGDMQKSQIRLLTEWTGLSVGKVDESIKHLRDLGYVEFRFFRNSRGKATWHYCIPAL